MGKKGSFLPIYQKCFQFRKNWNWIIAKVLIRLSWLKYIKHVPSIPIPFRSHRSWSWRSTRWYRRFERHLLHCRWSSGRILSINRSRSHRSLWCSWMPKQHSQMRKRSPQKLQIQHPGFVIWWSIYHLRIEIFIYTSCNLTSYLKIRLFYFCKDKWSFMKLITFPEEESSRNGNFLYNNRMLLYDWLS